MGGIEENLHRELDWLCIKHVDVDQLIKNILVIYNEGWKIACHRQREICKDELRKNFYCEKVDVLLDKVKNARMPEDIEK